MFCRNCGKELTGSPEFCMNCGAKPMAGTSFCPGCGAPTTPIIEMCINCGARVAKAIDGKTWKPTAAGILCIIAGVPMVVIPGILVAINVGGLIRPSPMDGYGAFLFILFLGPLSILLIIAGIVAIVGGIRALKRRNWGLALAGSICALPAGLILGILAIIFVVRGKREFG